MIGNKVIHRDSWEVYDKDTGEVIGLKPEFYGARLFNIVFDFGEFRLGGNNVTIAADSMKVSQNGDLQFFRGDVLHTSYAAGTWLGVGEKDFESICESIVTVQKK